MKSEIIMLGNSETGVASMQSGLMGGDGLDNPKPDLGQLNGVVVKKQTNSPLLSPSSGQEREVENGFVLSSNEEIQNAEEKRFGSLFRKEYERQCNFRYDDKGTRGTWVGNCIRTVIIVSSKAIFSQSVAQDVDGLVMCLSGTTLSDWLNLLRGDLSSKKSKK